MFSTHMNTACQYILKIRSNVYQNVIHEDLHICMYVYDFTTAAVVSKRNTKIYTNIKILPCIKNK